MLSWYLVRKVFVLCCEWRCKPRLLPNRFVFPFLAAMTRRFFALLFLLLATTSLHAPNEAAPPLRFDHLQSELGLSQNYITCYKIAMGYSGSSPMRDCTACVGTRRAWRVTRRSYLLTSRCPRKSIKRWHIVFLRIVKARLVKIRSSRRSIYSSAPRAAD